MNQFHLSETPIDAAALRITLEDPAAGGCVTFEGWVRNHNEARRVTRLDYQAYGPLASEEGEAILDEARAKFGLGRRQRRSSRRRVRGMPLDHRRSEAARADLEERALRRRRVRLAASVRVAAPPVNLGTRIINYGCCLPALTGFADYRREGQRGHHRRRWWCMGTHATSF